MKKNIWILFCVFTISISNMNGQTYYTMHYEGGGAGEFIANLKTWTNSWGIQFATGNRIRAMVNNMGQWCFLDPQGTYTQQYLNDMNQRLHDSSITLACDGNITAQSFQLSDIRDSRLSMLDIKFGRNGDATIGNREHKLMRIGSVGGIGIWGDGNYGGNDTPDLKIFNSEIISTLPIRVIRGNIKIIMGKAQNSKYAWLGTYSDHGLTLGTNNMTSIFMDNKNKVYIGLSDDQIASIRAELKNKYNLFLGKGVLSEDYAIAPVSSWSDFVFNADYKLRSFEEVENFINENKHLPDVPSAQQVAEEGYSQHDMNKILLQKIEELTLYTIQQQKEIDALKAQIRESKK